MFWRVKKGRRTLSVDLHITRDAHTGRGYAVTERNVPGRECEAEGFRLELDEIARQGAQRML